ncbi:MAG: hypothetical protein FJ100_10125 [Deltaproteobacteria bacterium]|nr:hypothetical protein [Deltaproteobacteria bacterium]
MAMLAACASENKPPVAVDLAVRKPASSEDNPFGLAGDKFVAITAEVPGQADGTFRTVKPYAQGAALELGCTSATACPGIPYTTGVQVRIELWSNKGGAPAPPVVGRGRSIPFDQVKGGAAKSLFPYVTRTNRFAPAESNSGTKAVIAGKAGAATATQPGNDGNVYIIGGAEPLPEKQNAFDPKSYTNFSDAIAQYSPNLRQVGMVSDLGPDYRLKVQRAFASAAASRQVVAVVGGYTQGQDGPKVTASIEYIETSNKVRTSIGSTPDLKFARAGATVVCLFEDDDYFLVLGGRGDLDCAKETYCAGNTWELWHKAHGNIAQGQLNEARWNHAAVKVPSADGGYVMLIGGENEGGVLQTFEVVQFSRQGFVSKKGQACNTSAKGYGTCDKSGFYWEPLTQALPVARTLPGAVFSAVPRGTPSFDYRYVYIVGGFEDQAHTKPLARLDVFNINTGNYLNSDGYPMQVARGAPMVALVPHGPTEGQILVAGGSKSATQHLNTAEFVYTTVVDRTVSPPTTAIQLALVENELPDGTRVLGNAVALNTGHVLVVGGVGTGAGNALEARNELALWNPF